MEKNCFVSKFNFVNIDKQLTNVNRPNETKVLCITCDSGRREIDHVHAGLYDFI